jgi:hypothetical protein
MITWKNNGTEAGKTSGTSANGLSHRFVLCNCLELVVYWNHICNLKLKMIFLLLSV